MEFGFNEALCGGGGEGAAYGMPVYLVVDRFRVTVQTGSSLQTLGKVTADGYQLGQVEKGRLKLVLVQQTVALQRVVEFLHSKKLIGCCGGTARHPASLSSAVA